MNTIQLSSIFIGFAVGLFGLNGRAEEPSNPVELDVDKLDVLQTKPAPVFDVKALRPAPEELKSAVEVDFGAKETAKWAGPKGQSHISVVISRSIRDWDNHDAHSWTRFLQKNGEAEAATVNCFRGIEGYRAVESYTLGMGKDGRMHYRHSLIWMNYSTCKGYVLRSEDTPVQVLGHGMAYAFRSECQECKRGERSQLHLIAASVDTGRLSSSEGGRFIYWTRFLNHMALPLGDGVSATLTASFSPESIAIWNRASPIPVRVGARTLRVEVSKAAGEKDTIGLVWTD